MKFNDYRGFYLRRRLDSKKEEMLVLGYKQTATKLHEHIIQRDVFVKLSEDKYIPVVKEG